MNETRISTDLDKTDRLLLLALQENARLSYVELGRLVGLTPTAAAERIRKLEEQGIILGYHASVSLEQLGYEMAIFVRLRVGKFAGQEIVDQMMQIPEVVACHSVTGEDCMFVRFVATSMQHMRTVLERLGKMGDTTTSIELFSGQKIEVIKSLF